MINNWPENVLDGRESISCRASFDSHLSSDLRPTSMGVAGWVVACGWLGGISSSSLGGSFVLAVRPCLCECDCGAGVVLVLPERWHLF